MCGLIGYVGSKKKYSFTIEKLKKLEYRGYDSSGLASLENNHIVVFKEVGPIDNLEKSLEDNFSTCTIAHTRWATNGKANKLNAHPHLSSKKTWAVVHNGIIENAKELKSKFNFKIKSNTDTAVISELLQFNKVKNIKQFIQTFKNVSGSYAILAINKNKNNTIFAAKNKSPLYVAQKNKQILFASDPICFVDFSKNYYTFNDNEFAICENNKLTFFNDQAQVIVKQEKKLQEQTEKIEKCGFKDFMLKEIFDQPFSLIFQVNEYKKKHILKKFDKQFFKQFNNILLIGCGTAYHACQIGANYFKTLLKINAVAHIASEFVCEKNLFIDNKTLCIFVSQSGETADTIEALNLAKKFNAKTIALTNIEYSTLAQNVDYILPVLAGKEIAVASTKAYVCQISALYLFTAHLANLITNHKINFFQDIKFVSNNILKLDFQQLDFIAESLLHKNSIIFIGKGLDFITATEAALKLQEVAYINSFSHPAGELKHGYLAIVEKDIPIIVFATQKTTFNKTITATNEAVSRGAIPYYFSNQKINGKFLIQIKCKNELLMPMLAIAPMQYLAYKISTLKNLSPDKPRNLAKSVTVS